MTASLAAVSAVTAAVAVLDWWAVAGERTRVEYVAKPATLVGLIGVALLLTQGDHDATQATWFIAALGFSLAGDVLLMLPQDLFIPGLGSFLVAHLCYVIGFNHAGLPPVIPAVGALVVTAAAIIPVARRFGPGLAGRPERVPVYVYVTVIALMVASALASPWRPGWPAAAAVAAIVGSILFATSDSMIGWRRFVGSFRGDDLAVIVTYHLGQAGLVLSIAR